MAAHAVSKTQAVPTEPPLYRFSVEQYHRMVAAGILAEDERAELLEGIVVEMSPISSRHAACVELTAANLRPLLPAGWHVRVQQPVTMATSEPEPDLAIVRGTIRDYADAHPAPPDVGWLIEVADSSLWVDQNQKTEIHAATGIPEYWIVNLNDNTVAVYAEPNQQETPSPEYATCRTFSRGAVIPVTLENAALGQLSVESILP